MKIDCTARAWVKKLKIQLKNLKKLKTLVWEVRCRILIAAGPDKLIFRFREENSYENRSHSPCIGVKIWLKNLKKLKTLVWEVWYRILTASGPDKLILSFRDENSYENR